MGDSEHAALDGISHHREPIGRYVMNEFMRRSSERRRLIIGMLVTIHLSVGCAGNSSPVQILSPTSTTPLPSVTQSANQIKHTLASPSMVAPTPTEAVSSPTPTVVPTPTPQPPLATTEEALAFVIQMQETNGGCELPCWWGITPGKTIGRDARQILSPLGEFGENYVLDVADPIIYVYTVDLHEYSNISIRLETKRNESQPVDRLKVWSFIPDDDPVSQYHESWRHYWLSDLFARLGMPTEVWLGFGLHTGDGDRRPIESVPYFWEVYIYYDDLGLEAYYAGPAIEGDPNRACFDFSQLKEMTLFVQQQPIVGPLGPRFGEIHPIQDVTDVSVEEFYRAIRDSKDPVCIESPAKYWP